MPRHRVVRCGLIVRSIGLNYAVDSGPSKGRFRSIIQAAKRLPRNLIRNSLSHLISSETLFHLIYQCTSLHDVFMSDVVLGIRFSVQRNAFHILVFLGQTFSQNGESLSILQVKHKFRHLRCTEYIFSAYRIHRIESHGREHIPGRHLSAIIVSAKSVRSRTILGIEDLTDQFLSTFRFAGQSIQISHVVTRFVTVSIITDQTGYISQLGSKFNCKQRIQLVREGFFSAQQSNQSRNIVLDMPGVLPCITFCIVATVAFCMCSLSRIERTLPGTV